MGPMMPPPPGMRGPMRIGGGPRGFLTDEEKQNKPKLTKASTTARQATRRCQRASTSSASTWVAGGVFTPSVCARAARSALLPARKEASSPTV